jgi:hypothetical protein
VTHFIFLTRSLAGLLKVTDAHNANKVIINAHTTIIKKQQRPSLDHCRAM